MSKANNIVSYVSSKFYERKGHPAECEWKACIDKLREEWSRLMLSNEDIDTILKIAAKLP